MSAWSTEAEVLELHLRDRVWLAGDAWTIGDLGVGAWVAFADRLGMLSEMPRAAAWVRRLSALSFWSRTDGYERLR